VLLLLVTLVVAGCGQDGSTSGAAAPTGQGAAFPVTLDSPGGKVVLDQRPERIVSLSPTATEMLFAIGAGGQVAAVDSNSNYPEEAPKTDLSAYQPNIEAIAGYKPDLVVYSDDPGELETFIGQLYGLLGMENIADAADKEASGYPQLSAEYVVKADPDLIFLADTKCCGQSARTVAARDGWDRLTAVRSGGVVALDDDVASRWGPRVVDFLKTVAAKVRTLETVGS
jgi:ABC-type Fe3+-hydroxamate transport system substrate-binding protein